MKISLIALPAGVLALFIASIFAAATIAQAPQTTPSAPGGAPPPHTYPAPTNLKVLPRDLTGKQVRDIMETWEGSLGVHCEACHAPDPNNIAPNGKPRLNFADDSKPEKRVARAMYTMTEEVNKTYIAKIDSSGVPVTCGTCHRGRLSPEPYVIPGDEPPQGPPPGEGTKPVPE